MLVKDIMTPEPATCLAGDTLEAVARLMVERDCGAIPVVDEKGHVQGVVTDRDITCRIVAAGRNPLELSAGDCMSHPVATIYAESSLEDCFKVMEQNKVRRAVVIDNSGLCCGMVAQADIALHAPIQETGEVVKEVSKAS
jgi:CBS domain-containing protein